MTENKYCENFVTFYCVPKLFFGLVKLDESKFIISLSLLGLVFFLFLFFFFFFLFLIHNFKRWLQFKTSNNLPAKICCRNVIDVNNKISDRDLP